MGRRSSSFVEDEKNEEDDDGEDDDDMEEPQLRYDRQPPFEEGAEDGSKEDE